MWTKGKDGTPVLNLATSFNLELCVMVILRSLFHYRYPNVPFSNFLSSTTTNFLRRYARLSTCRGPISCLRTYIYI